MLGGRGAKATPKSVAVAKQEADTLYEKSKAFNQRFKPVAGKLIDKRIAAALDEQTLPLKGEGMGSVREEAGRTIVEDDFQLICFDMVSEPSTPGAFMMREAKDFTNNVFTKADKINRLLNEVLSEED